MSENNDPSELTDEQLDAVTGGVGVNTGVSSVSSMNIQGMDLETALMAVQSNRANLLETQLQSQMQSVQDRNKTIEEMNGALSTINSSLGHAPTGAPSTFPVTNADGFVLDRTGKPTAENLMDEFQKVGLNADAARNLNKGQMEQAIQTIKGQIDAQGNSQQMDMLRLQSLSNKRNEAFDIMTNFVKKMQDSRSSIIGNMR